ncbi:MAG: GNAT family N-acetyltransferase [Leptolyngbya sp. BL-A-14]
MPIGYDLRLGSGLDRALLIKFMQRTYQEIEEADGYTHLAQTVEQYLSKETPLWWVIPTAQSGGEGSLPLRRSQSPVACLWLGSAIDQLHGDRHAHVFLLYVLPEHRRKGIGTALMLHAEAWAIARGDRQMGLQVFQANHAALNLYKGLGFQTQSLWMVKPLERKGAGRRGEPREQGRQGERGKQSRARTSILLAAPLHCSRFLLKGCKALS